MMQDLSISDKKVIDYYNETWLDYKVLWLNNKNRSIHFGYYDEKIRKHEDALLNLNAVMANMVGINKADHVLDAGCGQGGSSIWMAENLGATTEGVTLVPHQVEIANKISLKRGVGNKSNFTIGNYCKLNFPDNHFTVVWACESLCHAEEKLLFYKEAMRVLKPNGRLIVAEYIRKDRPLNAEQENTLKLWLNNWSITDIDTKAEHVNNMKKAGFKNIIFNDCTENVKPSLKHLYNMSTKLLPIGKFLQKIGLRNSINHGNQLGSIFQFESLEQNGWFYGMFSASK